MELEIKNMGKKRIKGNCRICGQYEKLTFEHVPPSATYNNQSVKVITLLDCIRNENKPNSKPWELDEIKGIISQRGKGGFYLCEQCNNNTGTWYGHAYKQFVDPIFYVVQKVRNNNYNSVSMIIKNIRPLAIFKQIMVMFCDINDGLAESDPMLREYILDKRSTRFDDKKYRVFMYMMEGGIERTAPIASIFKIGKSSPILVSEISAIPVGFMLYIDKATEILPEGTDITWFSTCSYDDIKTIEITMPIHENNSPFLTDFRSKEQIIETIKKSKQYENELSSEDIKAFM